MPKKSITPGVRARGNSIQIDFRYKGVRCRETLKVKPTASNIKHAANLLGKIHFDIAFDNFNYRDYFPNSSRNILFGDTAKNNMSFSETCDWWINFSSPEMSDGTNRVTRSAINCHIKPKLGKVLLEDLNTIQIREWRSSLALSNKSKNNIMSILRKILRSAVEAGHIKDNPTDGIESLKHKPSPPLPLKTTEIDNVLKLLHHEEQAFYQFAIWTGLRTGEQVGLQWQDINFKNNTFFIHRIFSEGKIRDTKNTKSARRVELLAPAVDALKFLQRNGTNPEWIFINPRRGTPWAVDTISKVWNKAIAKSKLKARPAYQTRHTFATLMLNAGLPLSWIQSQMGHSNYRMLETRYAQWQYDDKDVIGWVKNKTKNKMNGLRFNEFFFRK